MKKPAFFDRICEFIFFVPVGILYAWALSDSLVSATILEIPSRRMLFCCAVLVTAFSIAFFNKYTVLGLLGCLVLAGGWIFISLYRQDFEASWFLEIKETVEAFVAFARARAPYREEFAALAAWGIAFMFSFVTALNTRFHYGFLLLALLAAGVIMVPIYMEWGKSDTAIFVMLFCLLALLARKLYRNTLKEEDAFLPSPSRYALILLPVCLLAFGTGWMLPKPDNQTVGEMGLPDVAGTVNDLLYAISPKQTISFTEDGRRLGGPANLNDQIIMIVEAEEPLYLAGAIRDTYTGTSWLSSEQERADLSADGNGVFITDNSPEELRRVQNYFRAFYAWPVREVAVIAADVRTRTVFSPPFKQTFQMDEDISLTQDVYGGLMGSKTFARESGYTQTYISWDYQSPYFVYLLSYLIQDYYAQSGYSGLTGSQLDTFLELPDSLPDRVRDLAKEITADLPTDYEKLKALETYLARFTYNLNAGTLPDGEDFVDHFLFTAKEGYCVHYASAMTVMARSLGIPARFVEGYITPAFIAGDGRYWVTNKQAHAWVEAYFQGFGWVRFEPTSPYNAIQNGEILTQEEEEPAAASEAEREQEPVSAPSEAQTPEESLPADRPDADETQEPGQTGFPWPAVVFLLILGGVGFLVYRELTARYRFKQDLLRALPNREAVLALFASTLNAAEASGCPILPNETVLDYAARIASSPLYAGHDADIKRLALIYSKAAYSSHDIDERERAAILAGRDSVLRHLRNSRKNRLRYRIDHYILLRY